MTFRYGCLTTSRTTHFRTPAPAQALPGTGRLFMSEALWLRTLAAPWGT